MCKAVIRVARDDAVGHRHYRAGRAQLRGIVHTNFMPKNMT
jgi:hypothetical protein